MRKIKPIFKYVDEDYKKKFKDSRCLLTISVGQETHEGERLSATIELLNGSFGACIMIIDDSLQRHTMALNKTQDANHFYDLSLKEGDLWLERNKKYYKNLKILEKIIRWDIWLKHNNYLSQQQTLKNLINDDPSYKVAFDNSIDNFLTKYCGRLNTLKNFNLVKARNLCLDFVLEECTALCLWPELECHFEVYPNRHNMAIEETRKRFILTYHPNLLKAVTINFRNACQTKPQAFELVSQEE